MNLLRGVHARRRIVTGGTGLAAIALLAAAVALVAAGVALGQPGAADEEAPGAFSGLWDYLPENEFLSPFLLHNGILPDSLGWEVWQGLNPAPVPAGTDSTFLGPASRDPAGMSELTPEEQAASHNLSFGASHLILSLKTDSRSRFVVYDFEQGTVRLWSAFHEIEIGHAFATDLVEYSTQLTARNLRRLWVEDALAGLTAATSFRGRDTASNIRLELPVQLPPAIESIFGPGAPQLTVRGSERITMSGTSRWTVGQQRTEYGSPSRFPQLDMKQDLNVMLTGTVGEKLHIDVAQNSNAPTPLDNSIKLRYQGYDDEIIQKIDLGNTSLSLPGTRYVSYGGQHTGLFGINMLARFGDLDIAAIASKEEGEAEARSFSGSSETTSRAIYDSEFEKNRFFFFGDPDGEPLHLDLDQVQVWVDDKNPLNDRDVPVAQRSHATLSGSEEDTLYVDGMFHRLELGVDFTIERSLYYGHTLLALRQSLRKEEVLAVAYLDSLFIGSTFAGIDTVGTFTPGAADTILHFKAIKPPDEVLDQNDLSNGPWAPVRKFALRNVYYLGGQNIDLETLTVRIRRDEGATKPTNLGNVPFLRAVGLDRLLYTGTYYVSGHDDKIDWDRVNTSSGYMILPDLRPFAPDEEDLARIGPSDVQEAERDTLLLGSDQNPKIYDLPISRIITAEHSDYFFEVEYESKVTTFQIPNAMNLIPGSVVVTKNDIPLSGGQVRVDYELGTVEVLEDITATDRINISYQYAPLFALGQKTLAGVSARYAPQGDFTLATAWLFQSKGSPERRVRLEQEPIRTVVGDISASLKKEPELLTRLADALPLVSADAKSLLKVDAEIGLSFPNPNTRNEVYLDDFEGAEQNELLSLNRSAWRPSSIPGGVAGTSPSEKTDRFGVLRWYDPRTIQEKDLQPSLPSAEGDDVRATLVMQFFPRVPEGSLPEESWASLVQPLSRSGTDLSRHQFLDLWVNDGVGWSRRDERAGRIVVDLGQVSEDAAWDRSVDPSAPNGQLDSEDEDENRIFDQVTEDSGLDGVTDDAGDASRDDYAAPTEPTRAEGEDWAKINGTEGNRVWDTEDLNANGFLDSQANDYFEFTFDLSDTTFLVTDVSRDFSSYLTGDEQSNNGWRRYRIPLNDASVDTVNSPQWETIQHARVWLTGFPAYAQVQLGGLEVLGNRWEERALRYAVYTEKDSIVQPPDIAPGEDFLVSVLSNKEDSDVYTPPFQVRKEDNIPEREQSLQLEARNFPDGHQGLARRLFLTGQDYTLYESMKFFVRRGEADGPDVEFFVRFARDTLNYYEYRTVVPRDWKSVTIPLSDLSALKSVDADSAGYVILSQPDSSAYVVRGLPSFTDVRQLLVGVQNRSGEPVSLGTVWLDELRLSDVKKNVSHAKRIAAQASFSDLMTVSTLYESRGADFLQIGSTRGGGTNSEDLAVSTNVKADKFLEFLHVNMPVTYAWTRHQDSPKFQTGNDIEFSGQARDQNISERESRRMEARLSRRPSQSPWLRYSIDAFSLNASRSTDRSSRPTQRDSTEVLAGGVSYTTALTSLPGLRLPREVLVRFTPTNVSVGTSMSRTKSSRYTRQGGDLDQPFQLQTRTERETAQMSLQTNYAPFQIGTQQPITYSYSSARDLRLRDERFLGLRIGREIQRREQLQASTGFDALGGWISPSLSWQGQFTGDHGPGLRRTGDAATSSDLWNMNNSNTTSINMRFPVASVFPVAAARKPAPRTPAQPDTASTKSKPSLTPAQQISRLVRLGDVTGSLTLKKSSDYARVYGEPSLLYQLGVTRDRGPEAVASQNSSMLQDNTVLSFQGNARLFGGVGVDGRFSRTQGDSRRDKTRTKNYQRTWPDLKFDWGGLVQSVKLGGLIKSMNANSRYIHTLDRSGQINNERTTVQDNWGPLLQWSATWKNGIATSLTANRQSTETEVASPGNTSFQEQTRNTYSLQFRHTINTTRGINLPFGGKQIKMKSNIDLTLKGDYSHSQRSTRDPRGTVRRTEDRTDLAVGLNGGYSFSRTVSGNMGLNVSQIADKIRGQTTRAIGIVVSAGFNF